MLTREPADAQRKAKVLEARDVGRDDAKRERDGATLAKAVHPEARQARLCVRDVELSRLVELTTSTGRDSRDLVERGLEVCIGESNHVSHRLQPAVAAQEGRLPDLEMDVTRAALDGAPQNRIQIHGQPVHRQRRHLSLDELPQSGEARQRAQRGSSEAARLARVPQVATEEAGEGVENPGRASCPEARPWEAIGRALRGPRRRGVPIEGGGERRRVVVEACREDRFGGEPGRDEGLVDAVPREWVDEPGCVTNEHGPTVRGGRAEPSHGQPVPAHVAQLSRVDPVCTGEPVEMSAKPRAFRHPAPHADVPMVAFREHPPVTARDNPELDPRSPAVGARIEVLPGRVPLERDAANDPVAEAGRLGDDPVRAVRADHIRGRDLRTSYERCRSLTVERKPVDTRSVPEVGSGGRRLFGEMGVEKAPLGHQDERRIASSGEPPSVPEAQHHPVYDVLDHRRYVAGGMPERAASEPAPARLVAREPGAIREQDAGSCARKVDRRR